jgi:hypothetical protein
MQFLCCSKIIIFVFLDNSSDCVSKGRRSKHSKIPHFMHTQSTESSTDIGLRLDASEQAPYCGEHSSSKNRLLANFQDSQAARSVQEAKRVKTNLDQGGKLESLESCLPFWWKTELGGKHLPDIWPHCNSKMLYHLDAAACEELSNWWDQRNDLKGDGLRKFPKNGVAQLERYFSSSHGSVRQAIMAWRRNRDGHGEQRCSESFDSKVVHLYPEGGGEVRQTRHLVKDHCNSRDVDSKASGAVFSSKEGQSPIFKNDQETYRRALRANEKFEEHPCEQSISSQNTLAVSVAIVSESMNLNAEGTGLIVFSPCKDASRSDLKTIDAIICNKNKSNDESEDLGCALPSQTLSVATTSKVDGQKLETSSCSEGTNGINAFWQPEKLNRERLASETTSSSEGCSVKHMASVESECVGDTACEEGATSIFVVIDLALPVTIGALSVHLAIKSAWLSYLHELHESTESCWVAPVGFGTHCLHLETIIRLKDKILNRFLHDIDRRNIMKVIESCLRDAQCFITVAESLIVEVEMMQGDYYKSFMSDSELSTSESIVWLDEDDLSESAEPLLSLTTGEN